MWRTSSHCTLMADSIQVASIIQLGGQLDCSVSIGYATRILLNLLIFLPWRTRLMHDVALPHTKKNCANINRRNQFCIYYDFMLFLILLGHKRLQFTHRFLFHIAERRKNIKYSLDILVFSVIAELRRPEGPPSRAP